jgi:predicted RNA polymerase sigma factor
MIPYRTPQRVNQEIPGALKDRVSACRKRLRENRVMFRVQAIVEVTELLPETAQLISAAQTKGCEQTEEQEVGIT